MMLKHVGWQMTNIMGGLGDKMEDWVERLHQTGMRMRQRFHNRTPLCGRLRERKADSRNAHPDVIANLEATNKRNKRKYVSEKKVDVIGTRRKRQPNMGRFEAMHYSLCRPLAVSSRRLVVASPLVAPSSCPLVVLSLPTSLAAPATMAVVVPHRPGRRTLSSGWASPLRHRCPHHCPGCCFLLPSNLVPVAIALAAVGNARFAARHPRPPLSPSPSPSPSSSPLPLLARHHCRRRHRSCRHHHSLFVFRHHHHSHSQCG